MTTVPAGNDPFVVYVAATVQIQKLVFAPDMESAQDIALHEAADLSDELSQRTGLDLTSPFVAVEVDAREAVYSEIVPSVDPEMYPPLEPYFPTLVRDPDDDAFDLPTVPDFPPTDDKENR